MGDNANRITDWPETERPRERLLHLGADALSEAELLAIILRTGAGKSTAVDLARALIIRFNGLRGLDAAPLSSICEIKGIGEVKACQVKATLELAKRFTQQRWTQQERVQCSEDAYQYLHLRLRDLSREVFQVIFLTTRHDIILDKILFEGSLTESVVSPREIIAEALQHAAAALIIVHNHPSGDPHPSVEDRKITEKIIQACRPFDLRVIDHLIIGRDTYFSFADQGMIISE